MTICVHDERVWPCRTLQPTNAQSSRHLRGVLFVYTYELAVKHPGPVFANTYTYKLTYTTLLTIPLSSLNSSVFARMVGVAR